MNPNLYLRAQKARTEAAEQARKNREARIMQQDGSDPLLMLAGCIISTLTMLGLVLIGIYYVFGE